MTAVLPLGLRSLLAPFVLRCQPLAVAPEPRGGGQANCCPRCGALSRLTLTFSPR